MSDDVVIRARCHCCDAKAQHVLINHKSGNAFFMCSSHAVFWIAKGYELKASNPNQRKKVLAALACENIPSETKEETMTDENELNELLPAEGDDYKQLQTKMKGLNKIRSSIDKVQEELNDAMAEEMAVLAEMLKKYGQEKEQ